MKHLKDIPLVDWITMVGISATLLLMLTYATGCAVRAKVYTNQEACCERLDLRMKEMEEFNRYCMMMVFADRDWETSSVCQHQQQRR